MTPSHQTRREEGQILALFAGSPRRVHPRRGLVIDGGNVFLSRRDSQNSADIGSMAGTKRLADYYVSDTRRSPRRTTSTRRSRPG